VFAVRELVSQVRTTLERNFPDVWVEGEISNLRPAGSGHLYLTLKDGEAQLRVVMFRTQARLLRFRPENGLSVLARGRVTLYEDRGEMQLLCEYMEPMGAGALQVAFEQLKTRLAAEGLFAHERKKPLPAFPRAIGVVTSPTGAAIQDILNVLRRRHESLNVVIYPAQVQGATAAAEVETGVRWFNRKNIVRPVDVIIIARGGGSIEDLAAFNDEALARTIADSEIPVISAVGHETDFTICDFVADLRAPTPSAAAELVARSRQELLERIAGLHSRLQRSVRYQFLRQRERLTRLSQHGTFARMSEQLARRQQKIDELVFRLAAATRKALRVVHRRLDVASARVRHQDVRNRLEARERELQGRVSGFTGAMRHLLQMRRARLEQLNGRLRALSPTSILERGYALVFDHEGRLVKDAAQVSPGEQITARVARGEIGARVERRSAREKGTGNREKESESEVES
jgi:exodeoxyribonuclease VII large subunit